MGREARKLLGTIETAEVKEAISHYSASCLTPKESGERIKAAAKRAVALDAEPYKPEPPVKFEVEFTSSDMASLASTVPGVVREDSRRISHTAEDVLKCWSVIFPSMLLATTAEPMR